MIAVGTVIGGRFRVDQILGAGGMGIVVAATHTELGHRVAIKFLRDDMAQSPTIVDRFLREARSAVSLRTEHVCHVTDSGRLDSGAPYMVMELLEGADLSRAIARGPLPVTTAVEYVMQVCVALAEAHRAGIIHRDLKPANLFVTRRLDGSPLVKVLDFGIAKAMAETGANLTHQAAMGSPGYMSPEQVQSARDVDARTDIWALGVTLYQLLSARMPFAAANQTEVAIRVAQDAPDPLDVDPRLGAAIARCLEKRREARYPDVLALATDLAPFGGPRARQLLASVAQFAQPASGVYPSAPAVATDAATAPGTIREPTRLPSAPIVTPHPAAQARLPPTPLPPVHTRIERVGRARVWIVLVAVLVIGGGVAGIVIGMQGSRSSVGSGSAIANAPPAADAPPGVDATPTADATLVATVHVDAGDAWAIPDAAPADASLVDAGPPPDARPAKEHHHDAHLPSAQDIVKMQQQAMTGMAAACKNVVDPKHVDAMPPINIAMCRCLLKQANEAAAAIAKLSDESAKKQLRQLCAMNGIKL